MAKKTTDEAQVQTQEAEVVSGAGAPEGTQEGTQQPENSQENTENTSTGKKAPETPAVTTSTGKKVKIRTTENVNCIVAGVPYTFPKSKEVSVPSDVAAILVNGQKAYRI